MNNKPNLFNYATSELSQDALIGWLLSWASPEYKDLDSELYRCATELIKAFFQKHEIDPPSIIERVDVRMQQDKIDVLCIINSKYPIIIEDKTKTKNHSNQLVRYLENVRENFIENDIIPIYFKTHDQGDYSGVVKNGYKPFLRNDIIEVLNTYNGENQILLDYRSYLQSISNMVASYKSKEISKWDKYSWIGFYLELQKKNLIGPTNWDYVPNPTGGFMGFWWAFQNDDECQQYLQLEQDKLCIKIWVKNEDQRKTLREKWYKAIKLKANDVDIKLVRPSRFGSGEYMTVLVLDGEYRKTIDGFIDMDTTVMQLKKAEHLLKLVHEGA
jgi:hypothetical protein